MVARLSEQGEQSLAARMPHLFFFTSLDGKELLRTLKTPGVLPMLAAYKCGVAIGLPHLDDDRAEAARLLSQYRIPAIAWLVLAPEDGVTLNLENYPRAVEAYRSFYVWALALDLRFSAVGLEIETPVADLDSSLWQALREFTRRFWLARDNILYRSAYAAYTELIATIHHDGYEVHTYQMPLIADDRLIGTTLVQRALDIMDLPSDLDVLMCPSAIPAEWPGDLGGALIDSYGETADAIGVDVVVDDSNTPLPWAALRRDLLLAAQHTDMIYVFALEHCVRDGHLERIAALDWDAPARANSLKLALVTAFRAVLMVVLVAGRYGRAALAWSGWILAIVLWLKNRSRNRKR